jgi:iron-sulfur cluster repair protein YtfE (RIC family)
MANGTLPSGALRELLDQHAELRRYVEECEALMDHFEDGEPVAGDLAKAVAKLRIAFEAHNKYEESILRPVLIAADAFGPVRVDQMVEEHIREHRAVKATLGEATVASLRETFAALRKHLGEEERYFLSSKVLRDDLVTVESSG